MKVKRRFVFLLLLPILAAGLWFGYGRDRLMIYEARKVRTRDDANEFLRKYMNLPPGEDGNNGTRETEFAPFGSPTYQKIHAFFWRFDSNGNVSAYERQRHIGIFGRFLSDKDVYPTPPASTPESQ